ncbi:tight adherence protein C [Glaciihabitans tibetensis]|uniref:Tight adherence protein C n=1 Tax=Glaciihabitans tibetensis TaxID=1266600 RepID=A0A2T0VBF3_9MICO|nr:type II secretion system F family protein [Glaciihabitans tibetensis]PRY67510.1 tight adherence protein C [Glaciihabitans tibetensis]
MDAQGGEFQILTLPPLIIVAILCVAACVPVGLWALVQGDGRVRRQVRENLGRGIVVEGTSAPSDRRVFSEVAKVLVSARSRAKLDHLHALAGRPAGWPIDRLIVIKPALSIVAGLFGVLLFSQKPSAGLFLLVLAIVVLGYFVPDLLLHSRGIERQAAIALELPDTLDQMLIAVEAGLGFEAAMTRAGENGKGPLADEFIRTLQDMRVGMSRKDAYQALAKRTNVPDLRAFIRAVVQADAYGISISSVLRTQAKEMRIKRRQRAEEKAMQIPVKVLFPLMLFILPVLLIAVLGPTVITVMTNF